MTQVFPQCLVCRHFNEDEAYTCAAFPDGIADDILLNKRDHRNPLPGDNDIQWQQLSAGDKHPLVVT